MPTLPTSRTQSTASSGAAAAAPAPTLLRPRVQGKFLFVGEEKFWVRGVTYGTFRPDENGDMYPPRDRVRADFAEMARRGFNAVRTYDVPPRWLLDVAAGSGLRVMVGLWCEHVAFLDDRRRKRSIARRVRDGVRTLAGHPALLCYSISNEIPASIVRWHGRHRVERYLQQLYNVIKREDREALVTYVSFPTTEYLRLPFLDLVCFNVYLEDRQRLVSYLARLQNLSGDRPLLMGEIGLDSRRHGEIAQAETLAWQVRAAFDAGCCGTFVYAWTDEWFRGGHDIDDWDFGLTRRDRTPKPALNAVCDAYSHTPFPCDSTWPRVSVVVCSYNGEATIRDTLDGLQRLDYPHYEVIVVNDGSTDRTEEIASGYPVRVISTENRGLSNARNTGCNVATGEIVAYIDDDAYPDPNWLSYLALGFTRTDWVGVGGPNLPPMGDGALADCVANAPGGPVHVLLTDRVAEHIPGCNMAFRKSALQAIGGFDPVYRAAGDDVDLCWRLQERGGAIGFSASAVVWHHRRNSVRMYWKQQRGYGKAEALLERKWPQRYNAAGHLAWEGRLYGQGWTRSLATLGGRVYGGIWGSAPFQSLYSRRSNTWLELPLMPEWYIVVGALTILAILGILWPPLRWVTPLLAVAVALPVAQALLSARGAHLTSAPLAPHRRAVLRGVVAFLHLAQPLARLLGRIQHGLTPWRRRGVRGSRWALRITRSTWRESWAAPHQRLTALHEALKRSGAVVWCGGEYDGWDLTVRGGLLGTARLRFVAEEHGAGKQMLRFRLWPQVSKLALVVFAAAAALAAGAFYDGAVFVGGVLASLSSWVLIAAATDASRALHTLERGLSAAEAEPGTIASGNNAPADRAAALEREGVVG